VLSSSTENVFDLSVEDGKLLVKTAREVLLSHLHGRTYALKNKPVFRIRCGVFVTLEKNHDLRGCIGFVQPRVLSEGLVQASLGAGFNDPRFPPITLKELNDITIEVSLLSPFKEIKSTSPNERLAQIKQGVSGVLLKKGILSAVFLPQVWEKIPEKEDFLNALCEKAGLPWGFWVDPSTVLKTFNVIAFKEKTPNGEVERVLL